MEFYLFSLKETYPMPTNLLLNVEITENTEELTTPELETAAGYTVKSDVRAGQCPSSTIYQKYRNSYICIPSSAC